MLEGFFGSPIKAVREFYNTIQYWYLFLEASYIGPGTCYAGFYYSRIFWHQMITKSHYIDAPMTP